MVHAQAAVAHANTVSYEVVEKVAELDGVDPLELTPALYEVINPDALENLFATGQARGKVVFDYNGYEVTVFSDGFISVNSTGT